MMTDPTDTTTDKSGDTGQVDEKLDTTDGNRDPLTTDDGLAEAAEGVPQVDDRDDQDTSDPAEKLDQPVAAPELEVDDNGNDPLTDDADDGDDGAAG